MSDTGTIHSALKVIRKYFERESLDMPFQAGTDLKEGQEVYISGNNIVSKRTSGTKLPIGIVKVGALTGELATIQTFFQSTVQGIAFGAELNHGATVKQNGDLDADTRRPRYIIVADGDYCAGVVISGAVSGGEIRVGVLRSPVLCANESVS